MKIITIKTRSASVIISMVLSGVLRMGLFAIYNKLYVRGVMLSGFKKPNIRRCKSRCLVSAFKEVLILFLFFLLCNKANGQTAITSIPAYTWQSSQLPREFNAKLQLSFVKAAEGFPSYGTVLAGGGFNQSQDGSAFQIYFPYSVTHGGSAPRIRLGLYNNEGWSNWHSFFTSANANNQESDWKAKKLIVYDNIGIGTETPSERLAVNGNIRAREIKVEAVNWPDYVFRKDYELKTLPEIERYIQEHGHLPEVPNAEKVEEQGVSLGEMNKLLLKKVEELTLHLIEKDKRVSTLENEIQQIEERINKLEISKAITHLEHRQVHRD